MIVNWTLVVWIGVALIVGYFAGGIRQALYARRARHDYPKPGMPVGLCTRDKGHEGPCNGFPSEDCPDPRR